MAIHTDGDTYLWRYILMAIYTDSDKYLWRYILMAMYINIHICTA